MSVVLVTMSVDLVTMSVDLVRRYQVQISGNVPQENDKLSTIPRKQFLDKGNIFLVVQFYKSVG